MTTTVLGYGSQGRAHALNLRDSGVRVRLGLRHGPSWDRAVADGFAPLPPTEAVRGADVVSVLVPDMAQPAVLADVLPHLEPGALLLFAHGFTVHYRRAALRADLDVALVAPKAPGALVRREFEAGHGVPCLLAVHQDTTGSARARALAYADGLGGTRAGVLETSFAEETETDLFGEQAVLCGGVTELVTTGWEVLVEAGYNPELAYFECLHELKLIVDLLHEGGLARMHRYVSETASFGDLTRGRRVVDETTRDRMRAVLDDIRSGRFAEEWAEEHAAGQPSYRSMLQRDLSHPMEAVGARLRARMPWLEGAA
ncbi:MAG: ketol-acid reductoisomerase [Deltaproteobacteria bacterium]|nr:MAG: ketol-acid reductoisomerase [Deltaproteobacteria bacterium]